MFNYHIVLISEEYLTILSDLHFGWPFEFISSWDSCALEIQSNQQKNLQSLFWEGNMDFSWLGRLFKLTGPKIHPRKQIFHSINLCEIDISVNIAQIEKYYNTCGQSAPRGRFVALSTWTTTQSTKIHTFSKKAW